MIHDNENFAGKALSSREVRLRSLSVPCGLCGEPDGGRVPCHACAHRCSVPDGGHGICRVRFNEGGTLRVPHGWTTSLHADPIEKKPFFHLLPGSIALSFGTLGCNFHCPFCQNWTTSQALRDGTAGVPVHEISAGEIVAQAVARGARSVSSTYNEPLITVEWALSIFREARMRGLLTSFVSNGFATPEAVAALAPWLDGINIDLKGFSDDFYRELGGRLQPVLDTIAACVEAGIWVEVVTLIVPGRNDSSGELAAIASFLAQLSPDLPWHVTAYHPDYLYTEPGPTPPATLQRAVQIGREAGLHYVYAGNLPGRVGNLENTLCPGCGAVVIERFGFRVLRTALRDGACRRCGEPIAGRWDPAAPEALA